MEEKITSSRLDRIEAKIDKLAETVVSLARAEEKLITLEADRNVIFEKFNKVDDQIDEIESRVFNTETTVKIINRVFWIVLAAAITAITGFYTK